MREFPVVFVAACLLGTIAPAGQDPFEAIKAAMADAECCRFEFVTILTSEVFDSVDSTAGIALIASDGRYLIDIGRDEYLRTRDRLYSYSREQNQVTVERVDSAAVSDEAVSFVTRLDDFYRTSVRAAGREYFLQKIDTAATALPDSLTVVISGQPRVLDYLEYRDVNDELNRVVFSKREYLNRCDETGFDPAFPDTVEVINLF